MIGSQPAGKAFSADSEQFEPVVACTEELDQLLGRAVDRFVTLARHEDLRGASARDEPMHHCPDEAGFSGARRSLEQTERSEEHTSELQSLMRISYAVFCLKNKNKHTEKNHATENKCIQTHDQ